MQIKASPHLAHIVKHYLLLESDLDSLKQMRLFSDGNTGMVICLQNLLFQKSGNEPKALPRTFVYGQINQFRDIFSIGKVSLIVVVFEPFGAHEFLKTPASFLKDQIIALSDFVGREADLFEEAILEQSARIDSIAFIENFISNIVKANQKSSEAVKAVVNLIAQNHGLISVKQLADYGCMSERQLERKFLEYVGHTPKHFTNIMKLQYFLKLLKNKSAASSFTSLVYDAGFYDQAHLIKEFKRNIGLTPSQYQSQTQSLTLNFFQFRDINCHGF